MRMAVIHNDIVENLIEAPEDFMVPDRLVIQATEQAFVGGTYVGGEFFPPEEPDVPPQPVNSVTRRQIITGLGLLGWITEQEAIDALATGARPAAVNAVINQLPQEEQFPAIMMWIGFQTAYRNDSMVLALAAVAEKSEQDVDEFFLFCSQIN